MGAPAWERRFRAARVSLPRWALLAPERCAYATNATGIWQVWGWDRTTDTHRQLTDKPTGVLGGTLTPDGEGVIWFDDEGGSEVGRLVVTPFTGGTASSLTPDVEPGWGAGLAVRPSRLVFGLSRRDGVVVYAAEGLTGAPAHEIYRHAMPAGVAGLSRDGSLLALSHTEHGDAAHPSLRILHPADGRTAVDVAAPEGVTVMATAWSPVEGDNRLAIATDESGYVRPELLHPDGTRRPIEVDLAGEVSVAGWWPDASALLLVHDHRSRATLHRHDLATGTTTPLELTEGTVTAAAVRPDGEVWASFSSGAVPPRVVAVAGDDVRTLLTPPGDPAPGGAAYRDVDVPNGDGGTVHAFVVEPPGTRRPLPLVVDIHGGPTANDRDTFSAPTQAWVDHGFAVALINYRGSTGYGKAWEDAVIGDPGRPELVDVRAVVERLIADGVADPDRIVVTGGSWGGYLSLMGLGTQPDLWAAGVAVVPVADYVAAFEDESPVLQDYDRTLFRGGPDEVGDLFRERSPITYAGGVRAPVLIITGENDTRCPKRQVDNYVEALRDRGLDVAYDVFDAGHGSLAVAEQIRQTRLALQFLSERLGTPPPTEA